MKYVMKLITKELERAFETQPIYSQDGKGLNAKALAKFFFGNATWYVLEAEREDNDWIFFGLVRIGDEIEYGYFSMSELEEATTRDGVCFLERDLYFDIGTLVKDLDDKSVVEFVGRVYDEEVAGDK